MSKIDDSNNIQKSPDGIDNLKHYLSQTPYKTWTLSIASADVSFRKYYRLSHERQSVLLMDASLEKSSLAPFLDVTQRL